MSSLLVIGRDLPHPPVNGEERPLGRRSQYLAATALAEPVVRGGWPAALLALPLALAPSGAGAVPFNITTAACSATIGCDAEPTNIPGATSGNFKGGMLRLNGTNKTYSIPFTLDTSTTNTLNQDGENTTFTGVFSDATSGGNIKITNVNAKGVGLTAGSVTFSGINTYTGATTINTGATLALSGSGSIAASSNVVDTGTLDISAVTGSATINKLTGSGTVNLGSKTVVLSGTSTFTGAISGNGGVTVSANTVTFNNSTAMAYTGATTINSGATLSLGGSGGIGHSSGVVANGTLDVPGSRTITSLSGSGSVDISKNNQALTLSNASGIFSGVISGNLRVPSSRLFFGSP